MDRPELNATRMQVAKLMKRNIVKICQLTKLRDCVKASRSLLYMFPIYIFCPTIP